jgi:hypothetical protein
MLGNRKVSDKNSEMLKSLDKVKAFLLELKQNL